MSLIEEALRKHMEEEDKTKGQARLASAPVSSAPPPLPSEPAPGKDDEPVRKAWPILLAIVLGGIILVLGVAWLLLFGFGLWKRGAAPEKAELVAAVEAPAVEVKATGVVEEAGTSASPSGAVAEPPAVLPPAVEPAPQPVPVAAPEVTAAPVAAPAEAPPVAPVAAPAETAQVAAKAVLPVVWPKLVVNGLIGGGQSGRSAAMINRQMVEPGVVLEGVRVEAIDKNGVRLSFQGETRLVAVGGSTE